MISLSDQTYRFFADCGVYNHCPLAYMAESGKNVTPVDMKAKEKEAILAECDNALAKVLEMFQVRIGRCSFQVCPRHV